ncbi:Hypothetical protein MALK_5080 [Metamycoplasma alkalescens 14918]|uniref:Uncharacterized protein n=2 Tax=Metamycoplasma alkalescens TaxID=45363 RepID=N9SQX8_9BACT|nr:Hypothetical protein MALK_5080 [Metamycoplasma alkalescens 14918]
MSNTSFIIVVSVFLPILIFGIILIHSIPYIHAKKTSNIYNIKIHSKKTMLSQSIRLPKETFNNFYIFFKREKIYLSLLIALILFLFLLNIIMTLEPYFAFWKNDKKAVKWSFDWISIPIFIFVISYPLFWFIKELVKINKTKKIIDDWVIQNEKLLQWNKQIEKPLDYDKFKNTILYEDFEIKIPVFKDSKAHFYTNKILNSKKPFIKDNKIDIPKLLYFLLFDYDSGIQINNFTYSKEYFLFFIDECLNNNSINK